MGSSYTYKTMKCGSFYNSHPRPEMLVHVEETAVEAEIDANEQNNGVSTGFCPDMIEEKIKANLEPLHAQISTLTEMMGRLIQGNWGREFTTASTRQPRLQSESPFTEITGSSRFPLEAPLTTAGYSPDRGFHETSSVVDRLDHNCTF